MPSETFQKLKAAIRLARKITIRVDANNLTTPLDEIKVRSYIILSHAAIEEYLETISENAAKNAVAQLRDNNIVSHALLALVGHYKSRFPKLFVTPPPLYDLRAELLLLAEECFEKHEDAIEKNHGISISSVNGLMFPIGVDADRLSAGMGGALQAFSGKRGKVAHNMGMQTLETKSSIDSDLRGILTGLKSIDQFISTNCPKAIQFQAEVLRAS